jgi:hypothetical protein
MYILQILWKTGCNSSFLENEMKKILLWSDAMRLTTFFLFSRQNNNTILTNFSVASCYNETILYRKKKGVIPCLLHCNWSPLA